MDTYQSKFNDNLEYQSLISLLCPTKINEISLHLGDEKRAPSQHNGKESDILLTRVYNKIRRFRAGNRRREATLKKVSGRPRLWSAADCVRLLMQNQSTPDKTPALWAGKAGCVPGAPERRDPDHRGSAGHTRSR